MKPGCSLTGLKLLYKESTHVFPYICFRNFKGLCQIGSFKFDRFEAKIIKYLDEKDGREQKEKQLQDDRVAIRCHMLLFERLVSYE